MPHSLAQAVISVTHGAIGAYRASCFEFGWVLPVSRLEKIVSVSDLATNIATQFVIASHIKAFGREFRCRILKEPFPPPG